MAGLNHQACGVLDPASAARCPDRALLEEVDLAWYVQFGQPTDQIFANIIRVQNMTDLRHDRSDHRLTPIAVRDTIDGNLISTTVPPTYIVAANQLLSGDECHIGMAMRVRSSRVIESAKATVIAARVTLRCVRTHPFGLPVVPEV